MSDFETWMEKLLAEDAARVRRFLGKVVGAAGLTRRDMDKRLGVGRGYFSSVLTGRVELKVTHVSAILVSVGVHPGDFYAAIYPKDRPFGPVPASRDSLSQLEAVGITPEATPPILPAPPVDPAALKPLIEEIVRDALAMSGGSRPRGPKRAKGTSRKRSKGQP